MSRRWQGLPSTPSHQAGIDKNGEHLDLAAQYTCLLEAIHAKILNDPGLSTDEIFQFDITSDLGVIRRGSTSSPRSSAAASETAAKGRRLPAAMNFSNANGTNLAAAWRTPEVVGRNQMPDQAFNWSSQNTNTETRNIYSPPSPGSKSPVYSLLAKRITPGLTSATAPLTEPRHPQASIAQEPMLDPINNSDISVGNGMNELKEDELTAMSDGLLDQSFLELDRVITLDGTDFNFDISYWGRNEFV